MSAGSFKQDGLGWRINLIKQRVSEWVEFQVSQIDTDSWNWEFLESTLLWQIIRFCLWSIIAILLVWLTWRLWLFFRVYRQGWRRKSDRHATSVINKPQFSAADWIERSQAARIEANYRQAIFCLYQAMLQLLHERGIVTTQLSMTDQEYKRSLTQMQVFPPQSYELLLSIHQRLCFSKAEADKSLFEQCQQAYQQIEQTTP